MIPSLSKLEVGGGVHLKSSAWHDIKCWWSGPGHLNIIRFVIIRTL
jgi:hypothetical protein